VPAGVGSATPAPQGDAAGGENQVLGVEVDGFKLSIVRFAHGVHTGDGGKVGQHRAGIDVVLFLRFKAFGGHGWAASFPIAGLVRSKRLLA
jgi:hypothetical protein